MSAPREFYLQGGPPIVPEAIAAMERGDVDRAIEVWNARSAPLRELGDIEGRLRLGAEVARVLSLHRQDSLALDMWQQLRELCLEAGREGDWAYLALEFGGLHAERGQIEAALKVWQEGVELAERAGEDASKAFLLEVMAARVSLRGESDRALLLWQQALAIFDRLGDRTGRAGVLKDMSMVLARQGEAERAQSLWQEALAIFEEQGDRSNKASTLQNMGTVAAERGELDRAEELYRDALELLEGDGQAWVRASMLSFLGTLAFTKGDAVRGIEYVMRSISVFAKYRMETPLGASLASLGMMSTEGGKAYLAQAALIALRGRMPLPDCLRPFEFLLAQVPEADELALLLGVGAIYVATISGEGDPRYEECFKEPLGWMQPIARAHQAKLGEDFAAWAERTNLYDVDVFLPPLRSRLIDLVGDAWLFDRALLEE